MIPYKDLCTAIERFRVRRGADNGHAGRVATLATNGTGGGGATVAGMGAGAGGSVAADASEEREGTEPTAAMHDGDDGGDGGFPAVSGASVEVHAHEGERKPLSSETNEIDLSGAEEVGDDE